MNPWNDRNVWFMLMLSFFGNVKPFGHSSATTIAFTLGVIYASPKDLGFAAAILDVSIALAVNQHCIPELALYEVSFLNYNYKI